MTNSNYDLLTPEQVAKRLSVAPVTVRNWLRSGKLKGIKIFDRIWRMSEEDLQNFIESQRFDKRGG